ncbi:MAG: MFS transporter [Burkholderiales bacterium]|nr:MFS transporter [Burkholderiales bacterium]
MTPHRADWRTPTAVLVAASIILSLAMGIRHGFGLFLQPVSSELGWGRETFALALAVQNLTWGATQPFAGMIADRFGSARVLATGALLYVVGLVTMSIATSPWLFILTAGVLIGAGQSGVTYSVVSGVLGRTYPPDRHSMVLGVSAAAGSFGQFAMLPATQWMLTHIGWHGTLYGLAAVALLIVPLAAVLVERRQAISHAFQQSVGEAVREAFGHRPYVLLTLGYFVCGFQVVFVGVHLPAYLADHGLPAHVAVTALALVGLFNIIGTYTAGWLGGRIAKRYILSGIYFGRTLVFVLFFFLPLSPLSVYLFAMTLGFLWLSTVPPTNALVGQIFGVRYMAMLTGFTFFSHQVGSFLGAWLGGKLYDTTGSYDVVWYLAMALGIVAGLLNLPIDERAIDRSRAAPAT